MRGRIVDRVRQFAQRGNGVARLRRSLDRVDRSAHRRILPADLVGRAAFAGPEARPFGLDRRGIEADVFPLWRARRAGGAAIDPGRMHTRDEVPVIGTVLRQRDAPAIVVSQGGRLGHGTRVLGLTGRLRIPKLAVNVRRRVRPGRWLAFSPLPPASAPFLRRCPPRRWPSPPISTPPRAAWCAWSLSGPRIRPMARRSFRSATEPAGRSRPTGS